MTEAKQEIKLYRPDEVAKLLRVKSRQVYRWIEQNKMNYVKTAGGRIRIPASEVQRILNDNGTKGN